MKRREDSLRCKERLCANTGLRVVIGVGVLFLLSQYHCQGLRVVVGVGEGLRVVVVILEQNKGIRRI